MLSLVLTDSNIPVIGSDRYSLKLLDKDNDF